MPLALLARTGAVSCIYACKTGVGPQAGCTSGPEGEQEHLDLVTTLCQSLHQLKAFAQEADLFRRVVLELVVGEAVLLGARVREADPVPAAEDLGTS